MSAAPEAAEQPTHVQVPIDLMNEAVGVLMTLPAAQVFDLLTALRAQATPVTVGLEPPASETVEP